MISDKNIEVHLFAGDPGKGQDAWMYSLRFDNGKYVRGERGGAEIFIALQIAAEHIQLLRNNAASLARRWKAAYADNA